MRDTTQPRFAPHGGGQPARSAMPYWVAAVLSVSAVGMLLAFGQVVRGSVQRGELHRQAWVANAEQVRNCVATSVVAGPCVRGANLPANGQRAQNFAVLSQVD